MFSPQLLMQISQKERVYIRLGFDINFKLSNSENDSITKSNLSKERRLKPNTSIERKTLATILACSWIRLSKDSVERVHMKSIRWISNQNSSSHISHQCGLFRKIQRNKWMDSKIEPHRRRKHYICIHWRRKSKWEAQVKCIELLCLYILLLYIIINFCCHLRLFNSIQVQIGFRIAIRSLRIPHTPIDTTF